MEGAGLSHQQVFQACLISCRGPRPLLRLPSNTDQMNFMQSIHHSLPLRRIVSFHSCSLLLVPRRLTTTTHSLQASASAARSPARLCSRLDSRPIIFFLFPPLRLQASPVPRFFILCHNFSFPVPCIQTIMTMRGRSESADLCFLKTPADPAEECTGHNTAVCRQEALHRDKET